ncbi:hypothetical protein COLO4_12877 [Corchorus olitorius]|uniref:Uncharacterized protein n=1 Tax=Corchorus olitorius TaxID=93759 RepID=A0A1R3JZB7_9ROSI|nr:hypothetical protein COLO4_12877 [Corchorus olitorius]
MRILWRDSCKPSEEIFRRFGTTLSVVDEDHNMSEAFGLAVFDSDEESAPNWLQGMKFQTSARKMSGLGNVFDKNTIDPCMITCSDLELGIFGTIIPCKIAHENGTTKGFGFLLMDIKKDSAKPAPHSHFYPDASASPRKSGLAGNVFEGILGRLSHESFNLHGTPDQFVADKLMQAEKRKGVGVEEPVDADVNPDQAQDPAPAPDPDEVGFVSDEDDGFIVQCGDPERCCLGLGCPCYERFVYCDPAANPPCTCPCRPFQACENLRANFLVVAQYAWQHGHGPGPAHPQLNQNGHGAALALDNGHAAPALALDNGHAAPALAMDNGHAAPAPALDNGHAAAPGLDNGHAAVPGLDNGHQP